MAQLSGRVTTGDALLKELYEVSAEYQATLARLRANGTDESLIDGSHYLGALQMYLDSASELIDNERYPPEVLRTCMINLATLALRYARKLRQP